MKTSSTVSHYAGESEIARAVAELQARAQALTTELKVARVEARQVHPLADFRPRSRNGRSAAAVMKKSLSSDAQAIVTRAERLAECRDSVTRAANYLGRVGADLARTTIIAATAADVTGQSCVTFQAIIGRWRSALDANGEKLMTARQASKLAAREAKLDDLRRRFNKLKAGRG